MLPVLHIKWQGLKAASEEKHDLIKEKKLALSTNELGERLPSEFAEYIDYTRTLGFEDKPQGRSLRP